MTPFERVGVVKRIMEGVYWFPSTRRAVIVVHELRAVTDELGKPWNELAAVLAVTRAVYEGDETRDCLRINLIFDDEF